MSVQSIKSIAQILMANKSSTLCVLLIESAYMALKNGCAKKKYCSFCSIPGDGRRNTHMPLTCNSANSCGS